MKQTRIWGAALLLGTCAAWANADTPANLPTPTVQAAPTAGAAQAVTLRLKFTSGQTLYYRMVMDMYGLVLTGQSGAGMPIKQHMEMLMHQSIKEVRATDGAATINTGIDSMTMTMNGQSLPMPPDKLAQMKDLGTIVLLPTGKTVSFTPSAAFSSAAIPGMDFTKMNSLSTLGQLPERAVKTGDTWKSAVSMGMFGTSVAAHFALANLDTAGGKNIAVINQTTNGLFNTSSTKGAVGPMGMKLTGKINGTGVLRFDVDAGTIENQTSKANISMNMTPPGAALPMKMQMKMNTLLTHAAAPPPTADPKVQ